MLKIKVVKDSIWYKKVSGMKLRAPKIAIYEILKCTKTASLIHFRTRCCQNMHCVKKMLLIKVVKE